MQLKIKINSLTFKGNFMTFKNPKGGAGGEKVTFQNQKKRQRIKAKEYRATAVESGIAVTSSLVKFGTVKNNSGTNQNHLCSNFCSLAFLDVKIVKKRIFSLVKKT